MAEEINNSVVAISEATQGTEQTAHGSKNLSLLASDLQLMVAQFKA